ncbi:CHASE3 domain-containing protein [Lichenicoccus roseus]|uniref:histidine kinase n=1 Tax=Lichenicoccus roseus TaxID=2683649 RepID=A0A5R9J151_9PROT|nr:CHASE3 domain-containing protein [Lichenicoccus roseus]TLU71390.1 response regulator [Lichenicoccus roseus]
MTKSDVTRTHGLMLGVLCFVLLLIAGLTWSQIDATRTARIWSQHTEEVLGAIQSLNVAAHDAETGQRGYLLTGDDDYLLPYEQALGRVTFLQGDLQRLTADNAVEQDRLRQLSPILQRKLEELAQTVQLKRDGSTDEAMRIVQTKAGLHNTQRISSILDAMMKDERLLLQQRLANGDRHSKRFRTLLLLGIGLALLALLWGAHVLRRAWVNIVRLETEQRTAALRLHTSLDSLSQGVAVFNADRRLTDWNPCFQQLLDLPVTMLRQGNRYADLASHVASSHPSGPDAQPGLEDDAARPPPFLETEAQIRHGRSRAGEPVIYERSRADGRHLELRRTPMPDAGFVLTITDMTKRAQAEAVLREAQKMQAIGQLTGGIAHDFNNLLTVILGNLEIAQARLGGDAALSGRIERATWAAQRGAALTAQLLAFARKQPLSPKPIDIALSIPDLVPLLRRTLGEHIEVRYVETAGLWPAMADAAQLESAVLNLALNARDAMPGGGRLTIELANKVLDDDYARQHAEVTAGDYTMLAVSDTGHGMSQDVLARVFEPFFTTKPDGHGTGLGLAMVFGFTKQSGGHVKVYSEPGVGTTVRLYLPRARSAPAPQVSSVPVELPRGTATLLVVEDEPTVREISVAILVDLGYRVLDAADGEEALRVFGAHAEEIDLLLTDVVLPGDLRGRALAERISALKPGIMVVYMSGYTENSIVHHGRLDEGVHLIAKPFKREQLARKLAEVLGAAAAPKDRTNILEMKPRRQN